MSWKYLSIGQCVESTLNCNPASAFGEDSFDYIDISSVNRSTKKIEAASSIEGTKAPSRARQIVALDDVIVSTVRPNLNGVALITEEYNGAIASTGYCVLRPKKDILDSKYLFYWVTTSAFIEEMMKHATGANYPAVSDRIVKQSLIPLPPLEEQKRIAEVLDKADRLRQKDRQLLAHYDQLLQSVFLDMFGDLNTNSMNWEILSLGELIVNGPQNGLYKPSKDYGSGTPILRIDSFYDGEVRDLASLKRVRIGDKEIELYKLREDDIVINRVNSRSHLGKCGHIKGLLEDTVFESNMMRLSLDFDRANPTFLVNVLITPFMKVQILNRAKDAVNQSSINQQDIKSFIVPLPPLKLQNEFSAIVTKVERVKRNSLNTINASETLFQSLLQKAFKGELHLKDVKAVEESLV